MTSSSLKRHEAFVFIYLIFAFVFFFLVVLDVMNGTSDFQFYSDSKTYQLEAEGNIERGAFFDFSNNTFGPVQILLLLGPRNYFLIFLFNIFIFLIALIFFKKSSKEIDIHQLYLLLLISPITFTSLMSINKEIFSFLCVAMIVYNHSRKNYLISLLILPLTYIVRWQFTMFYLIYLFLFSKINILKRHRFLVTILLLLVISGVLFVTRDTILGKVFERFDNEAAVWTEGRGTFIVIQSIQDNYGYIIAFIPKVLLLLCSMISRYSLIFDFSDAYNNFILFFQTIWNIVILFIVYKKRCINFKYDYFYLAIIYFAIFAITPVFNTRYFYPGMMFLCYLVSQYKMTALPSRPVKKRCHGVAQ